MFYNKKHEQAICAKLIRKENEWADAFPDKTGKKCLNRMEIGQLFLADL